MYNILITGAKSDIAKPIIKKILREENFKNLYLVSRKKMKNENPRVICIQNDFSKNEDIKSLEKLISEKDISHYLMYHGTANQNDSIESFSLENFIKIQEINFISSVLIVKTILGRMVKNKFGRILLTSTASASFGGGFNSFSYGVSKNSIDFLVKYISKNYSKYNILINAIAPGFIDTDFHRKILNKTTKEMNDRAKSVRLGRAGKPEELVNLSYALTFDNNFTTGQVVRIDGGDF